MGEFGAVNKPNKTSIHDELAELDTSCILPVGSKRKRNITERYVDENYAELMLDDVNCEHVLEPLSSSDDILSDSDSDSDSESDGELV